MEEEFDLKKEYEKLRMKHLLPDFIQMIEDFDIEKISEKESSLLMREIRRAMNDKINVYFHFLEILINPVSPPVFVFSILKNISKENKERAREVYKILAKVQIDAMKLDIIYKEDAEVRFINETFNLWQEIKLTIYNLSKGFEIALKENNNSEKRSYFD